MVDCVKKEIVKFYYHTLICNKFNFNSLYGNFSIIIWPRIRFLLEGISFILDAYSFEFHKRVASPRLDSMAFAYFINEDFVNRHKLILITKKHLILVEGIDSRHIVSGDVMHETIPLM